MGDKFCVENRPFTGLPKSHCSWKLDFYTAVSYILWRPIDCFRSTMDVETYKNTSKRIRRVAGEVSEEFQSVTLENSFESEMSVEVVVEREIDNCERNSD